MGKRPAGVELFEGNMASMQREIRPSMQRDEPPTMATGLERIAGKARCGPTLRFTSLAHHITPDRVWRSLCQIPNHSAPGVDGQTVSEAKESFEGWIGEMLQSVHRKGYKAPDIRRVYIPKPGKQEKRPLGVPTVSDRALHQRIAEQRISALFARPLVRACGEASLTGRSLLGAIYRRLCGVLSIPRGCSTLPGRPAQTARQVRPYARTDQDQAGRIWPVRAATRE